MTFMAMQINQHGQVSPIGFATAVLISTFGMESHESRVFPENNFADSSHGLDVFWWFVDSENRVPFKIFMQVL